jgi:hypothetical protein
LRARLIAIKTPHRYAASNTSAVPISPKEHPMFDLVMLAVALILFAVTIGYAYACDRL